MLAEGLNCWRIERADRAAFIVDGADYFRAVHEAVRQAHESIFIIGWDIHSKVRLIRGEEEEDWPAELGALLDVAVERRPNLQVHILSWDFAMIYAAERELFPQYSLRWKSHERVHFHLDSEHPVGASQHQKLVVIDDRIAFAGGLDLSKWRWDTCAHHPDDDRRIDPSGDRYPPFHDVQMLVEGAAARALGELARERWRLATDSSVIDIPEHTTSNPWPRSVDPDLRQVDIGIARTLPEYEGRDEVREVERLYLESIAAAERFIYIENQYLSSHRIGQALAKRLKEPDGPEIVIVTPKKTGGWLEQHTMDVLRARLLKDLHEADHRDRLRVFFARLAEDPLVTLMIHAKVMIVDDVFARVSSSNLSNRSMGLDSECDLIVESTSSNECRENITRFRRRLMAEHLGASLDDVRNAEEANTSLIGAIEHLRGGQRSLEPLEADLSSEVDDWVPDGALLDPEKPLGPEDLLEHFVTAEEREELDRGLLKPAIVLGALLALAAAWRWTPLGDWLHVDAVTRVGEWLDARPFSPLLVLTAFVIFGSGGVPITLLIVAAVVVFGPLEGGLYALGGAVLSALASFGLGHVLGKDVVRRLAGGSLRRISRRLGERGIMTTITVRIVPVAPFSVINVIAGVSEIRLRDFTIGTLIGMLPGVLAVAIMTDWIVASLREPTDRTFFIAIALVAVAAGGLFALRQWLRSRSS